MEDPKSEIERIQALGLHGVKIHPDVQQFLLDDERMMPIYATLAEKKLPHAHPLRRLPLPLLTLNASPACSTVSRVLLWWRPISAAGRCGIWRWNICCPAAVIWIPPAPWPS